VKFIVMGVKGKARPRFVNGHAYTPQGTKKYEDQIKQAYLQAGGKVYETAVRVRIKAHYRMPSSISEKEADQRFKDGCLKKPDVDNIAKAVMDGLHGVAYKDDKQVVKLVVEKEWDTFEFVEVWVNEGKEYKEWEE